MKNKINFGCGNVHLNGWTNIDNDESVSPDVIMDLNKFPYKIKSNSVDVILLDNVMEHLLYPGLVIKELIRIARPGCKLTIIVPHENGKEAYNDFTHVHYVNERAVQQLLSDPVFCDFVLFIGYSFFGKLFPERVSDWLSYKLRGVKRFMRAEVTIKKNIGGEE